MTGSTTPPVGYLTTQPPHAQCARLSSSSGTCGPPIRQLGDNDVLVVADRTSTSLIKKTHPNTTVAGRPAQVTTTRTGGQYGADQIVATDIRLSHDEVLRVTAYLGRSATAQHERVVAMVKGATLRSSE
jgi:hypothetical protein